MKQDRKKLDEHFVQSIMDGIRKAVRKLVEETAARNGSLVIEREGKIVHVPAKELLKAQENKKENHVCWNIKKGN